MASTSVSRECSQSCIEDISEYHLKVIITELEMLDDEKESGLKDVTMIMSIGSKVTRLENIENCKFPIGREIVYQLSSECFAEQLKNQLVTMNLYRGPTDLGYIKFKTGVFSDSVLCDDFECDRKEVADQTFKLEGVESARVQLVIEVSRQCDFINPLSDFVRGMNARKMENFDEMSVNFSDISSSCCEQVSTDICPTGGRDVDSSKVGTTSTSKSKSGSKCRSDIVTSLDIESFSDHQTTFCHACGGFSISGITCENKLVLESLPPTTSYASSRASKKCPVNVNRICSECFENLTVLPKNAPCPKCAGEKKSADGDTKPEAPLKIDPKLVESYVEMAIRKFFGCDAKKACEQEEKTQKKGKSLKIGEKKRKSKADARPVTATKFPKCCKVRRMRKSGNRYLGLRVRHPGVIQGHKDCQQEALPVPRNMGWLWNVQSPGINEDRAGWRPGAIRKSVVKLMEHFKKAKQTAAAVEPNILDEKSKSTLRVQKKAGVFTVVMNPKQKKTDCGHGDGPIVFKIAPNDETRARQQAMMEMKFIGVYRNCKCSTLETCQCLNKAEKMLLARQMCKMSTKYGICPPLTWDDLDDVNDSEMDFEFTPPNDMAQAKKAVAHSNEATQCEPQVIEKCPSSVYEEPPSMCGEFQKLNKLKEERMRKIREARERAKALMAAEEARLRAEAEQNKLAAAGGSKKKKKVKRGEPVLVPDPKSSTCCKTTCFNPCGMIRCGPKINRSACNSICQPCPLPTCEVPPTCSRIAKFCQRRFCN